ncbi:hypothetical protein V8F06_011439 [Rhypophila decipiens]
MVETSMEGLSNPLPCPPSFVMDGTGVPQRVFRLDPRHVAWAGMTPICTYRTWRWCLDRKILQSRRVIYYEVDMLEKRQTSWALSRLHHLPRVCMHLPLRLAPFKSRCVSKPGYRKLKMGGLEKGDQARGRGFRRYSTDDFQAKKAEEGGHGLSLRPPRPGENSERPATSEDAGACRAPTKSQFRACFCRCYRHSSLYARRLVLMVASPLKPRLNTKQAGVCVG